MNNERLARLETSLQFIKDILTEIKSDLKSMPNKEDYIKLENRVISLEKDRNKILIKVGILSGILGAISGFFAKYFLG